MNARERLELYDAACAGTIDVEQQRRLDDLLREDEHARREYLHYCRMHTDLHFDTAADMAQRAAAALLTPKAAAPRMRVVQFFSQPLQLSLLIASVTVMALLMVSARFSFRHPDPHGPSHAGLWRPLPSSGERVAQVVRTRGGVWGGSLAPRPGEPIAAGADLQLAQGLAVIRLQSGAELVLQGPIGLRVDSPQAVSLDRGRLVAQVPPQAAGFTLHTPQARLVDLGTEFAARVEADGSTETFVFAGRVEVHPASGTTKQLSAGEGGRMAAGQWTPQSVPQSHFVRALPRDQADQLVRLPNLKWSREAADHRIALSDDPPRSSARPLKMMVTAEGVAETIHVSQTMPAANLAGRRVTGQVFLRHDEASRLRAGSRQEVSGRLIFRSAEGRALPHVDKRFLSPQDPTDTYLARQVSAVAPAGTTAVTFSIIFRTDAGHQSGGAVLLDDAALVVGPLEAPTGTEQAGLPAHAPSPDSD